MGKGVSPMETVDTMGIWHGDGGTLKSNEHVIKKEYRELLSVERSIGLIVWRCYRMQAGITAISMAAIVTIMIM